MLKTNLTQFESDVMEVVSEFGANDLDISLEAVENPDENLKINVTVGEKSFAYFYVCNYDRGDALLEKRHQKRYAKLSAYKALSEYYVEKLPWGALTGIRPTKLAYQQGEGFEKFFTDTMFVSDGKTALIKKILDTQRGIYRKKVGDGDLFVSIPFCPTRCAYCSFISNEIGREKRVNEYIDALIKEIKAGYPLIQNLRSVYVGGGTPVSLSDELFNKLLDGIGCPSVEYTIEAGRPDCITREKLEIMKAHGVTRICVNPQTFSDKTLALIGRKHTAEDIFKTYALVREYDFKINMDFIAGLPDESFDDFVASIEKAIELSPDNITVHTLCLKKGSKLKESTERLPEGEVEKMVEYAHKRLDESGYNPYYLYRQKYMAGNLENTGYAKPGAECVYNIDIMEETTDIIACGANAVSKKVNFDQGSIVRIGTPKDILSYLGKVDAVIDEKNELFKQKPCKQG